MNLTKRNKVIIAAAALAGAAAVTGSAFTAGGLSDTSNDSFIGGTVDQTIFGATITNVVYDIDDDNELVEIVVTLATTGGTFSLEGRTFEVELYDASDAEIGNYSCTDVTANVSSCTPVSSVLSTAISSVTFRVDN